ncbi:MAG: acylphosphatase [Gemmatimonadota bacterium]|nr:acylphosphatase [Gemmatimonadota bacterium]
MTESRVHWIIEGRVQGVGFRHFTTRAARELGVRGTVRNRADGAVEVVAAGPADALDSLRARLRKGPPSARVRRIDDGSGAPDAKLPDGFEVRF